MRTARQLAGVVVLLAAVSIPAGAQSPAIDYARLREETAQRLAEYLRINTSNPPGNELATARWLQQVLAKEGIDGQILDTAELGPGRANFYARLKGSGSGKAVALVHHMDVVPVSPQFWSVDPFAGVVKDGYVWGRGALDMKGHGIIQLMTLIALKRAGIVLPRDVVFIGNADEESDGLGSRTPDRPASGTPFRRGIPADREWGQQGGTWKGAMVRHQRGREAGLLAETGGQGKGVTRIEADPG